MKVLVSFVKDYAFQIAASLRSLERLYFAVFLRVYENPLIVYGLLFNFMFSMAPTVFDDPSSPFLGYLDMAMAIPVAFVRNDLCTLGKVLLPLLTVQRMCY
ncbi:hypothetical protein KC19_6G030700 [Ceratodon purpureus]|uniref:Uncharacterized protein n=1 Tax=Ceratodon purpureus TaxID=3225 RepID=A0A8T0H9Q4_CERPU|nr:hypothetical protein KC19_6G030700 [Ceratodon purpureus]